MKKILLLSCFFILAFGLTSFAQDGSKKYVTYTFTIHHLKTKADAEKIDKFMLTRKGIVSSKTDLEKGTGEVKTESYILYSVIMQVVKSQGFEASEEHKTKKEN